MVLIGSAHTLKVTLKIPTSTANTSLKKHCVCEGNETCACVSVDVPV